VQREAQPGDNEGKLSDLGEAQSCLHRRAHPAAREERPQRDAHHLPDHDGGREHHDGGPVAGDERRVDEHAHGDEKDGPEYVPHRLYEALDLLLLAGFGDE